MTFPTVIELPIALEPVTPDTFIEDGCDVTSSAAAACRDMLPRSPNSSAAGFPGDASTG
jgi:hypothetical protein